MTATTSKQLPRWAGAVLLPLLNLVSALLVAGLAVWLLGENPAECLSILVGSALLNPEGLGYTLFYASTFIFTGLAVSSALQAGLFNIGAEGQMYIGGLGLAAVVLTLDRALPGWLLIPLALLAATLAGAAWAWLPGWLQARRGSHIVVTTIMFNFIAASVMNFIIVGYLIPEGQQHTTSRMFETSAWLPRLNQWFPLLGESPLNVSFLLALLALALYGVAVARTPWGYALRATGANQHAAHYAGISISGTLIGAMLLAGAFAGMAAGNAVLGSSHNLTLNFPAGAGFIGIAIALMGRNHPVGILLASVLFGALIQGGFDLSLEKPNIPAETFIFIQGLIILFCGALENLYAPVVGGLLGLFPPRGGAAGSGQSSGLSEGQSGGLSAGQANGQSSGLSSGLSGAQSEGQSEGRADRSGDGRSGAQFVAQPDAQPDAQPATSSEATPNATPNATSD